MPERSTIATTFNVGDWKIEPAANRMFHLDQEVRLEPKVMRVLMYLAERQGDVVSRHDLETHVWSGMIVTDDAVTNAVIKLRKALGDNARNPRYIETIAKTGYRLIAETSAVESVTGKQQPGFGGRLERLWRKTLIAALGLLLGGSVLWWATAPEETQIPIAERVVDNTPVIAVMPLKNLSADPEQEYFANGITEDLITDLSKLAGLRVVARNSSFAYKDSGETPAEIGSQLHARYLLMGSVRKDGKQLRINIRLTDTKDGSNRWAERYDRKATDIFRLQDEITNNVVSVLQVELSTRDRQRLLKNYATDFEAYDLFLQGLDHFGRSSREDSVLAKEYFGKAIAIAPKFARAYASLALTHTRDVFRGQGNSPDASLAMAESLVSKARQLDDSLPQVHFVSAEIAMYRGNYAAALDHVSRAIEFKPSYADGYGLLGWILHWAGRPADGLQAIDKAFELNPRVPGIYYLVKGALRYELDEIAEATQLLETAVEMNPNNHVVRFFLAAAYAAGENLDEARWQVDEILVLNPDFTLAHVERVAPIRDPNYRDRFLRDLQRAGLSY
jgi:TolB-like protein/DNA-binding winged helix-turn-helix (wHTH) protein/Tfp pilus assembly protein PilF